VHPDHQGRRLYARLGELTHASAREAGLEFLIGVPNANSTHCLCAPSASSSWDASRHARSGPARDPAEHSVDYARVWDERTVRWRLANPSTRYNLRVRGGCGEVRAVGRPGIRALLGFVDPAFAPPGLSPPPPGLDPSSGRPRAALVEVLYVNLPMRLRPAPLNSCSRT
jgi:hypothetical protein